MDPYVVLVAPDHVPDEFGGSYEDVCQELGLDPIPGGYVLYLLDSVNGRATVISTNTRVTREAVRDHPTTGDGYWVTDVPTVAAVAASDDLVDVVAGWPEELGGSIRWVFCREPDPEWVYEGADVRVLLDEPASSALPREVLGTEVVGCIDWPACGACHDLIEAADQRSWHRLLDRHDSHHVPMTLQAAWREFWTNHRPSRSAPPAEWTPGRRRIIANHIRRNWDQATAEYSVDDLPFTDDLDVPELAARPPPTAQPTPIYARPRPTAESAATARTMRRSESSAPTERAGASSAALGQRPLHTSCSTPHPTSSTPPRAPRLPNCWRASPNS